MCVTKKTIPASTPKPNARNAEEVVFESSLKPAPDKGNNHGPDVVPEKIVVGGVLGKKGSPKRASTDDKTSRRA